MKRIPALLTCLTVATLALGLPAAAQNEDCLTVLDACQICVLSSGQIDIRACGESKPREDGMPPEMLEDPDITELDGLQKLIGERILSHWEVLSAIFSDKNRIYLPRLTYELAGLYPGATGEKIRRAAVIRFQDSLIRQSRGARVVRVATSGGHKFVIQANDSLMVFVIRVLTDAGAFADADLSAFKDPSEIGLTAPDVTEEPDEPLADEGLYQLFEQSLRMTQADLQSALMEAAITRQ